VVVVINKFEINTSAIKNIKVHKNTWENEGFLCIDNFLDEKSAYLLHSFLSDKMKSNWWSRVFRSHEEGNQIKECFRIDKKEDKQKSIETLAACHQAFGKHVYSYAFDEASQHVDQCHCILCNYKNFLKSNMFKTFMHGVTDKEYQLIRDGSYKPTRYLSGQFLSPHEDYTNGGGVAMMLSLTPGWLPAYGGNLQITTSDHNKLKKTIVPAYNKLVLINNENKSLLHGVTHVAPYVGKARYTLSARLEEKIEHSSTTG